MKVDSLFLKKPIILDQNFTHVKFIIPLASGGGRNNRTGEATKEALFDLSNALLFIIYLEKKKKKCPECLKLKETWGKGAILTAKFGMWGEQKTGLGTDRKVWTFPKSLYIFGGFCSLPVIFLNETFYSIRLLLGTRDIIYNVK